MFITNDIFYLYILLLGHHHTLPEVMNKTFKYVLI